MSGGQTRSALRKWADYWQRRPDRADEFEPSRRALEEIAEREQIILGRPLERAK